MSANTQAPAGKKKSAGSVLCSIVAIALIAFAGYYAVTNYVLAAKHSITVNDKTIDLRSSIKELEDQGFVLVTVTGEQIKDLGSSVSRKTIHNKDYYIGIPGSGSKAINTGICITVGNFNSESQSLRKCTIYKLEYYPEFQKDGATVLIDGKDMRKASLEDWTAFFKEKGFPFSDKDLEEFKSGKSKYISEVKGNYKYGASLNSKSKANDANEISYDYSFKSIEITRDVKVKYIGGKNS